MFLNAYKSDVNTLSFLAATDNSFANLKLADGTKSKAYESDSKLKTFYQHYFDQGTLTGYAAYRYTGFRYYGQSTLRGDSLMPLSLPYATTTKPVRASELLNGTKPAYALFETGLSYGLNSENKHEETPFIGLYYRITSYNVCYTKLLRTIDPTKMTPETLKQFQSNQDGLSSALGRLMVVVEKYPELKANQNFLELQSQLEGTENRITTERRLFRNNFV